MLSNQPVDLSIYEKKAKCLKALSHPVRLCIAKGLLEHGACNVTTMHCGLQMPQSTISQHLTRLKEAGIVTSERKGTEIYYYVASEKMRLFLERLFME